MKICYICNEYPPRPHGGIGTYLKSIAEGMANAGHEITVIGVGTEDKSWNDNGVNVIELSQSKLPGKLRGWGDRLKLYRLLSKEAKAGKYDIVEVPDYQGWLPFKFNYCPVVVKLHLSETVISNFNNKRTSRQIGYFERKTLRTDRVWVGVSKWAYEKTVEVFEAKPENNKIIYYPVNQCEKSGSSLTFDDYILYAGTVSERKGALTLARASVEILERYPGLTLVYAGPEANDRIVTDIGDIIGPKLIERVHFTGRVSRGEIMTLMTNARVFAFPSQLETFGLVIAEAMLCGTPAICCNTGPCPEFVTNNETGLMIEVDDSRALSISLERIITDQQLSKKLAENGMEYIRSNFSIEKAVRGNLDLYKSLIG